MRSAMFIVGCLLVAAGFWLAFFGFMETGCLTGLAYSMPAYALAAICMWFGRASKLALVFAALAAFLLSAQIYYAVMISYSVLYLGECVCWVIIAPSPMVCTKAPDLIDSLTVLASIAAAVGLLVLMVIKLRRDWPRPHNHKQV